MKMNRNLVPGGFLLRGQRAAMTWTKGSEIEVFPERTCSDNLYISYLNVMLNRKEIAHEILNMYDLI